MPTKLQQFCLPYIHQKSKKVPKTVRRTDPDPKSLPIPQKLFRFVSLNLLFFLYISTDSAWIMHLVLFIYKLCLLAICVCEHHQQQHQQQQQCLCECHLPLLPPVPLADSRASGKTDGCSLLWPMHHSPSCPTLAEADTASPPFSAQSSNLDLEQGVLWLQYTSRFVNRGAHLFTHLLSRSTGTAVLSSWINSNEKARQSPPRGDSIWATSFRIGAFARVSHVSILSFTGGNWRNYYWWVISRSLQM